MAYLLQPLSFRLTWPSFLLSNFASQLKLIQYMVWDLCNLWCGSVARLRIPGICVTSSILRVSELRFLILRVLDVRVSCPRFLCPSVPVPRSWVTGKRAWDLRVLSVRVPGPVYQVLVLDYANLHWCTLLKRNVYESK